MKSSQETVSHLVGTLAAIYARPHMYVTTLSELDGLLFQYHRIWAFILELESELMDAHIEFCGGEYGEAKPPEWFYDRIEPSSPEPYRPVIEHWRKVDKKLGIATPA